jgi:hypothetical protein
MMYSAMSDDFKDFSLLGEDSWTKTHIPCPRGSLQFDDHLVVIGNNAPFLREGVGFIPPMYDEDVEEWNNEFT